MPVTAWPGDASRRRRSLTNAWLAAGLGVVVVLDLLLLWIVAGPVLVRRFEEWDLGRRNDGAEAAVLDLRAIAALDPSSVLADGVPAAAYDRVVRVTSWAYLLSTAIVVYATGLWTEAEEPLLLVLAIGGVFIIVAHDLLPAAGLGPPDSSWRAPSRSRSSRRRGPHRRCHQPLLLRLSPRRRGRGAGGAAARHDRPGRRRDRGLPGRGGRRGRSRATLGRRLRARRAST